MAAASEALYRTRQLWWAITAALSADQRAEIQAALTPSLYALFCRMHRSEQFHAYQVWSTVRTGGPTPPDLTTAALLHDVGKSKLGLNLAGRISIVLGSKLAPGRAAHWGDRQPQGFYTPFVIARQHPAWGAEMVTQAGARPAVIWLIANHQAPPSTPPPDPTWSDWLARLVAADNEH